MDFCCSLLNGGVHLHVSVKHYKAICAPHPKSFRSLSPLQFILYKPPEGAGERKGPGARAGSWPFVSKQMEMGRGEEKWRIRERGGGEENGRRMEKGRGGRKSQSVLIKCCIEDDVPPQCVSSVDGPPLIQTHARTICTRPVRSSTCLANYAVALMDHA
ncbi:hypothetical protein JOQ06_000676 [Pogonophryne albipinna]|uniref:Uncharacterized protein n=1 Tax=Pogonophryne albipinna TaxID=1090488 RepID=A0AAD6AGU0_9TELE|nr:hypothetical protein JOQ06_000676 [Pogonophryne albipinna]